MDSVQVNPALALAVIFDEADLYVHSDGLMTYSPTRKALPLHLSQRLTGLVCVDLVPGLVPQLLAEERIAHLVVPRDPVRQLIKEICAATDAVSAPDHRPTALILGQYLGSLQLLTWQQEIDLHHQMITEAAAPRREGVRVQAAPECTTHRRGGAERHGGSRWRRADHRSQSGDR